MDPETEKALINLVGVLGSALIGAIGAIIVSYFQRKRDNAERAKEDALREQRQEIRLQEIEAKLDEHNGYALKFTETHDSIVELSTDVKWIKEELKNGKK